MSAEINIGLLGQLESGVINAWKSRNGIMVLRHVSHKPTLTMVSEYRLIWLSYFSKIQGGSHYQQPRVFAQRNSTTSRVSSMPEIVGSGLHTLR